jgi:predicted NBD/HSP70 family sugar kinase
MYVGIDIGGTKTLVASLSETGELLESRRFPTNRDYDQFLQDLSDNIGQLHPGSRYDAGAAGIPGLLDRQAGTVQVLGNLPWRDKPIRNDISRLLDGIPMLTENDARLAGLSEAQLIKDTYSRVLFFTVSTGLGGALVENGRIVTALQDMEAGKMPLMYDGKLMIWEDFAGGRAVVERFHVQAKDITDPEQWREIGEKLGYGLAATCSVLQPEVIVLGGSVGAFADKYESYVMDYLKQHLHPIVRQPKAVLAAQRPGEAVLYGCYDLIRQQREA